MIITAEGKEKMQQPARFFIFGGKCMTVKSFHMGLSVWEKTAALSWRWRHFVGNTNMTRTQHQFWLIYNKLNVSLSSDHNKKNGPKIKVRGQKQWVFICPSDQFIISCIHLSVYICGLLLFYFSISVVGVVLLAHQMTGSPAQRENCSSRWPVCLFALYTVSERIVIFTGTISQQTHSGPFKSTCVSYWRVNLRIWSWTEFKHTTSC